MSINHAFDFFVQWHLTERCNLSCKHCYQTGRVSDEMSVKEIRDVLEEVSETLKAWKDSYGIDFSPSINVTGGEPFLRKDFFEILSEMSGHGFDLYVLTNGILIDEKKAEELSRTVKGVQVSIEGTEEIHDSIRGKGSFRSSMKGAKNLLNAGIKVTLNATLSSINSGCFMEMIETARNIGAQKLGFSRLVPAGKGELLLKNMLGIPEVKELYKKIFALELKGLEIVTGDPVASQMTGRISSEDRGDVALGGCAAGISGITILPDGTLLPCRRMNLPLGNIRTDSLREIWASSPVLEAFRDRRRYKGKCAKCRRWASCRGCRAIAYAYSKARGEGDFLAEDPQCFIEQA